MSSKKGPLLPFCPRSERLADTPLVIAPNPRAKHRSPAFLEPRHQRGRLEPIEAEAETSKPHGGLYTVAVARQCGD